MPAENIGTSPKVLRLPRNMALILLDDVAGMSPSIKVSTDSLAADSDDHSLAAAVPCFYWAEDYLIYVPLSPICILSPP